MDLRHAAPTATAVTAAAPKSPEAEPETPTRIQPSKPVPFSNGVLKRHHHHHHPHSTVVTYKECLKNHAASLGGHAVDGCGEFMPDPNSSPSDPASLKCAACGCHRNFHRRDPDDSPPTTANPSRMIEFQPHHRHHPPPSHLPQPPPQHPHRRRSSPDSSSPPPISSSYYPSAPHMLLALSTTPADHAAGPPSTAAVILNDPSSNPNSRKRFRTKFSPYQKQRMLEFAEKVGWKMLKREDETVIQEFCNEIGVERNVLKVWMHNNKSTLGKREAVNGGGSGGGGGDGICGKPDNNYNEEEEDDDDDDDHDHDHDHDNDNNNNIDVVRNTNASSSSS